MGEWVNRQMGGWGARVGRWESKRKILHANNEKTNSTQVSQLIYRNCKVILQG